MNRMKKINLLHVVFCIMSGGVEQMLLNYFSGKEFENYNLYLAYSGNPDERCLEEFKKCGFNTIKLNNMTKSGIKYYQEIKSILKKYKIDIVHSNINTENHLVMKAAYDCNVPVRISHAHGLPNPSNNILKKQVRKIKSFIGNKYSNCNLACSSKAGDYLFGKDNYRTIYNAINISKFKFDNEIRQNIRKSLGIKNEVLVGYIARFNNGKNHDFLIDTFEKMNIKDKNMKVVFIGSGPFKECLQEKINMLNLQEYILILSSKKNIYDYYQAMDLFVFPSDEEGLGMVAIESQINGLYCICSKGVPIDTKISNIITYIDLDENLWIEEISKHLEKRNIKNNNICNFENYDILKQRKVLNDLYNKELMNEKVNN